jgi:hypothetical protein
MTVRAPPLFPDKWQVCCEPARSDGVAIVSCGTGGGAADELECSIQRGRARCHSGGSRSSCTRSTGRINTMRRLIAIGAVTAASLALGATAFAGEVTGGPNPKPTPIATHTAGSICSFSGQDDVPTGDSDPETGEVDPSRSDACSPGVRPSTWRLGSNCPLTRTGSHHWSVRSRSLALAPTVAATPAAVLASPDPYRRGRRPM